MNDRPTAGSRLLLEPQPPLSSTSSNEALASSSSHSTECVDTDPADLGSLAEKNFSRHLQTGKGKHRVIAG